jgi:hypothetical protein
VHGVRSALSGGGAHRRRLRVRRRQAAKAPDLANRRRGRLAFSAKAAGIVLAAAVGAGWWQPALPEAPSVWHTGSQSVLAGSLDVAAARPAPRGQPTRLRIPAIGVDAGLVALVIGGDGTLVPPVDYHRPGWYADGTPPGQTGPAVIAGHVDSATGPAVFAQLHELAAGDMVEVERATGWLRFVVTRLGWYPKSRFPTAEVYGPTPDAQLRLITCGGGFDHSRRSYTDNLVVYAVAV